MRQLTISNSLVYAGGPVIAMESTQSTEQDVAVLLQLAGALAPNGGKNACEKILLTALNVATEAAMPELVKQVIVRLAIWYSARLSDAIAVDTNRDPSIKPWQSLLDKLHYAMKLRVLRGYCNTHKDSPQLEAYMSQVPCWGEMVQRLGVLENLLKVELNELKGDSFTPGVQDTNQDRIYKIGLIRLLLARVCNMADKEYLAQKHLAVTRLIVQTLEQHPEGLLQRLPESAAWQCFVSGKLAHRLHNTSLVAFPF